MFAIVDIAGFQEKVSVGDTLNVPLLEGEAQGKLTFDKVLMVVTDAGDVSFGSPLVKGAVVEAEVVKHGRDDKIRVFKFRHRKRYMRNKGHRQDHTTVVIKKITAA